LPKGNQRGGMMSIENNPAEQFVTPDELEVMAERLPLGLEKLNNIFAFDYTEFNFSLRHLLHADELLDLISMTQQYTQNNIETLHNVGGQEVIELLQEEMEIIKFSRSASISVIQF